MNIRKTELVKVSIDAKLQRPSRLAGPAETRS